MKLFTDKWSGSAAFGPLRERDALMDAYEQSGKTPLRFSADLGADPATFELWLKIKHGSKCAATRNDAVQFVEAVPCGGADCVLMVELAGVARVESALQLGAVAEWIGLITVGARDAELQRQSQGVSCGEAL